MEHRHQRDIPWVLFGFVAPEDGGALVDANRNVSVALGLKHWASATVRVDQEKIRCWNPDTTTPRRKVIRMLDQCGKFGMLCSGLRTRHDQYREAVSTMADLGPQPRISNKIK